MKQSEPLVEFGIRPEDAKPYITEKSFYLPIRYGPSVAIPKGETVWLSKATGDQLLFCNKAAPVDLGEFFKVIQTFRQVKDGEWVDLKPGDILKLTREEAIEFLRKRYVVETEEEVEIDEM